MYPNYKMSLWRKWLFILRNKTGYLAIISFTLALALKLVSVVFQSQSQILSKLSNNIYSWVAGFFAITVLFEIWILLVHEECQDHYESMISAQDHIISEIGRVSNRNQGNPIDVRIIGARYSHISTILGNLAERLNSGDLSTGPLNFCIYHADEHYLKSIMPDQHSRQSVDGLQVRLNAIPTMLKRASNKIISVDLTPYRNPPYLYVYIIGDSTIFWGTFRPDPEHPSGKYYIGPSNPCFVIRRKDVKFMTFYCWLRGICDDYERLQRVSSSNNNLQSEDRDPEQIT